MGKQHRSFSVEQKLQIIQEAEQNGITQTLRKHQFGPQSFSKVEKPVQPRRCKITAATIPQSRSGAQGITGRKCEAQKNHRQPGAGT